MDIKDVTTWSDFELEDTRKYCEWALAHKDFTSVLDADGVLQEGHEAHVSCINNGGDVPFEEMEKSAANLLSEIKDEQKRRAEK